MASEKIALIGSGNWGSAVATIIGQNVYRFDKFDKEVRMWVFEEVFQGRKLTETINSTHENYLVSALPQPKYLPGIKLPHNIVAVPDIKEAVAGATMLVFVVPHQFLGRLFADVRAGLGDALIINGRVKAISLIKGIDVAPGRGLVLISDLIRAGLGGSVGVSVLMGANVADEVAEGQFCEATIGCRDAREGALWKDAFDTATFRIALSPDEATVELCGALKNVVALGAGFVDGLGMGTNTKAAIMRIGLVDMMRFCAEFYGGSNSSTFYESCGVADLITTCFGGRNRKVAEAFVKTGKGWDELEATMLGGQKLQGTLTAVELRELLERANAASRYPLFMTVAKIIARELPPRAIVEMQLHVPSQEHAYHRGHQSASSVEPTGARGSTRSTTQA